MSLFCNDTATTEIYTLSLRYALTIRVRWWPSDQPRQPACSVYPPKVQELGCANGQVESGSGADVDRKSTRLNSSHANISYAVFCLKEDNSSCIDHKRSCEHSNRFPSI